MAWVTTLELEISTGSQGKSHVCTTARYPTSPRTYGHYLVSDGTQREQWRASRTKNPYRLSTSTLVEFCEESFGEKGEGRREKDVWELAAKVVPKKGERAWRFNQALMELGALVCRARKPKCPECPVRNNCRTFTTRPPSF